MKIFLIYPLLSRKRAKVDENKQFWPPLGLAYIAAAMERAGHTVKIFDRDVVLRKEGLDFDTTDKIMMDAIRDFRPDFIGISATTPNMLDAGQISAVIRKHHPTVPIVIGGPHATALPIQTLEEYGAMDIAVAGEGENTWVDMLSGAKLCDVKGIAYRKDDKVVINGPRPHIEELDSLPFPARHLLDMEFYLRPSRFTSRNLILRTTSIFTARGCPYRCTFCAGPIVFPGRVRFHSAQRVVAEIDDLVNRYNVEALYFAEDMFLASKSRAAELLEAFIRQPWSKRIKWFAQARVNVIDSGMLDLMKRAGCVGVEYGFESGSQRILDAMNKVSRVEDNIKAATLTHKAGMRFQANIIVGYPGETKEDFEKTIEFLGKIRPSNIGFNVFMPLPGTAAYNTLMSEGRVIPPWDEIGDPEMSSASYADMSREDFEKMYLLARFKVILPLNLRNFIKDNINNPFRLIFLLATQFWGTAIKTVNAFFRLKSLNRRDEKQ
jgi:anaerobic magnesium-protoporphyrin IX monomethyl ester cyclase